MSSTHLKILVISPAWIGDAVMNQSLLKLLKIQHPGCTIDVLAASWCQDVIAKMPEVNQVHVSPFRHGELRLRERIALGKSLRKYDYDWVIVTKNSFKSAIVPFFAGIPRRTGWRREFRYGLLNDIRHLDAQKLPLMIERLMALGLDVKSPLPEEYPFPSLSADADQAAQIAATFQVDPHAKKILALCPGAEFGPAKRWPANYFAEMAKRYINKGWQVWIFGGPKDQDIAQEIMEHSHQGCVDLTGKTSLADAIDLMSLANLLITNDTGLMHIAAALDKQMVVIYGSSSPAFTPPLSDKAMVASMNLDCSPCFQRTCPLEHTKCLNHLTPDVLEYKFNKMRRFQLDGELEGESA